MTPDEPGFRRWYAGWAKRLGLNPNPDDPRHSYNYRAAYQAGATPDTRGHWPSQYKLEGHQNLIVNGVDTRTGRPPVSNGPPKSLTEWIRYLHAAAAVPKGSADYADSQEAVQFALSRIRNLNTAANVADQQELRGAPEKRTMGRRVEDTARALGVGLMNSVRIGEPIAGAISAIQGKGFGSGAQAYREGLDRVESVEPTATFTADMAGSVGQSAVPGSAAFRGGTAAMNAIEGQLPNALVRFLHGAAWSPIGKAAAASGTLGAVGGFSAGGEDPGDIDARLKAAGYGAGLGVLVAAGLGGLGAVRVPKYRMKAITQKIEKAIGKGADPQLVTDAAEVAIRRDLERQGFKPKDVEQAVGTWRARRQPRVPQPEVPLTTRPGETVTVPEVVAPMPGVPKGRLGPEGVSPPAGPARPSFWEQVHGRPVRDMRAMPDVGAGKTLPYYPRGGQVEQAVAPPPPVQSPIPHFAPNQNAAFAEFLKGATPEDLPTRIATLRALGVPLTPAHEAELMQLLLGPTR